MADILNLQGQDPEPTPGDEKWSGLSIGKCGNWSMVSVWACTKKV